MIAGMDIGTEHTGRQEIGESRGWHLAGVGTSKKSAGLGRACAGWDGVGQIRIRGQK